MIEKEIEDLIAEKIRALGINGLQVVTGWSVAPVETDDAQILVDVRCAPRAYETYTTPAASFTVTISAVIRYELLPDLSATVAPLIAICEGWQTEFEKAIIDFSFDDFAPVGVMMTGGEIETNRDSGVWIWTQNLTLHGSIIKE